MVVIGGMRSFLGPALGALFYILFREFLSIWTPRLAVLFRPPLRRLHHVLADRPRRALRSGSWRPSASRSTEEAAMAGRTLSDEPLPAFLKPADHVDGADP